MWIPPATREIGSLVHPAVIGRQKDFFVRDLSVEFPAETPVAEKFGRFSALERNSSPAASRDGKRTAIR